MRRWWGPVAAIGLLLGWVGWVAWLLVSPPTLEDAMPKRYQLACQPIGRDIKDVSMMGTMSDEEEAYVEWIRENRVVGSTDREWERNRLRTEVTAACSELRTSRLVSLVLVVAGGLAVLVVGTGLFVSRRLIRAGGDDS